MRARSILFGLSASVLAVGILFSGCGDDDDGIVDHPNGQIGTPDAGGAVTSNSIAPNTFLTFEGQRYRLVHLEQANLATADSDYEEAGVATEIDIDQSDLTVYRLANNDEDVFTYAAASGEGEEATPALWYQWAHDPE